MRWGSEPQEMKQERKKDGKGKRLKFTEDRNERQSGKTDEKPAKRREIDCSVFLELCIVLRDHGGLAQLGERVLCKHEVIGSIPLASTIRMDHVFT